MSELDRDTTLAALEPSSDATAGSTRRMTLNMGPQHPSTHGVLRVILELDGETILKATPDIGFLHTGIEKQAEALGWQQVVTLTDRMDYLANLSNNLAYCLPVEKLLGIEIPPKAQYLRVLLTELSRINSHIVWLGTHALDLGAMTVFFYCFREREDLLRLFEMFSGQRLMTSYIRIGGVALEPPRGWEKAVGTFLKNLPSRVDEYEALLNDNPIFRQRTQGVGYLPLERLLALGVSGPMVRAAGLNWDIRKAEPYSGYEKFDFRVPVYQDGDVWSRYRVRVEEMRESGRIATQAMEGMRVPAGEAYVPVESPRGEIGFYCVSDGSSKPLRVFMRTPSFANLQALPDLFHGRLVADSIAALGSMDFVLGDVDR